MQLSRQGGYNLQAASLALNGLPARRVTRPGRWGNPFSIEETATKYGLHPDAAQAKAVALCAEWLAGTLATTLSPGPPPGYAEIRAELSGHNLACWCRPGMPCNADILISIANEIAK